MTCVELACSPWVFSAYFKTGIFGPDLKKQEGLEETGLLWLIGDPKLPLGMTVNVRVCIMWTGLNIDLVCFQYQSLKQIHLNCRTKSHNSEMIHHHLTCFDA